MTQNPTLAPALAPDLSRPSVSGLSLRAQSFAAILGRADGEEALGKAAGEDALPKAMRRRMTAFDAGVARCVAGLAAPDVDEVIVFASRFGNMGVTLDLLVQLIQPETLSPAKFTVSVHNAAAGTASQILRNRAGHTAVAAGMKSLKAGLTEAWARIATGSPSVLLVYSDFPLMSPYEEFDEPGAAVQLAVRLCLFHARAVARAAAGFAVEDGRAGAQGLVRALQLGAEAVSWRV
ncbi:MAG: beta-ketoacyl synthase chain length factor [Alphaproteobacteria bacterium]|nr:beta-ketoacyl synthase chain length factor [Alphaproteobacteria bacterium]